MQLLKISIINIIMLNIMLIKQVNTLLVVVYKPLYFLLKHAKIYSKNIGRTYH